MPLHRHREHFVVTFHATQVSGTWTDMPAALAEFFGLTRSRHIADLTNCREVRLHVNTGSTAGDTNAEFRLQYSVDGGSNWAYFDGSSEPKVNIAVINTPRTSNFIAVPAAAKIEGALLRIVGINGNGTIDPTFNLVAAEFR